MPNDPVFWANESLRVAFGQRDLDAFDGNTRAKYSVPLYIKQPKQAEIERRADCYPDLLEACRRFSGVMNLLGYENDPTAEFGRAAIEKATGVSNDQG